MAIFLSSPLLSKCVRQVLCRLLAVAGAVGLVTGARAQEARVPFGGATAQTLRSADVGAAPSSQKMILTLTLAPDAAKAAALEQYASAVANPASASYHRWLTPAQFASAYGAAAEQLTAVRSWAAAQGLSVDAVSPSGLRVSVSGSVARVESAFAVSVDRFQAGGTAYLASTAQASLPVSAASLFAGVEGLNEGPLGIAVGSTSVDFAGLATVVDANQTSLLALTSTMSSASLSASEVTEYRLLLAQAAVQGMTVISSGAGDFPAVLPEVTAVALPGGAAIASSGLVLRPDWQVAQGLPGDGLRAMPDVTVSSLAAFAQTLQTMSSAARLGNVNSLLYRLAPEPGLFAQADGAKAGTWEQASGLGTLDLIQFQAAATTGAGQSFTSFAASSYSPTHGAIDTFTAVVTSGTGGPQPTGTVTFTSNGAPLATVTLVSGSATYSINTLEGGNYTIGAMYNGDSNYATSTSRTSGIYVGPEASTLTATITGATTIGSTYTVLVTDTAPSGVGQPAGPVTLQVSGTGTNLSQVLTTSSPGVSTAKFHVPATSVGTLTLSISCTTSADFSCYNPLTTTVTIAKATPVLSISYTPTTPISGAPITLNAVVTTVNSAPAPTGAVTFYDNGTVLNASQLSGGTTTTTGVVPTTATHSITATYAGDANYNMVSTAAGSSSSGTISTTTTLGSSATNVAAGLSITFTAVVTPSSTGPAAPSGTVNFLDNNVVIGTSNLNSGVATFSTSQLSGTINHVITAVYSGDSYYTFSTSNTVTVGPTVAKVKTSLALAASSNTLVAGQAITFTATINPASTASAAPSGAVQFFDGATLLGSGTVSGSTATFTTTALAANVSHSVTAVYGGDTNYAGSSSPAVVVGQSTGTTATTTTLTASPSATSFGNTVALTAVVTPPLNGVVPTGSVQFLLGTTTLCITPLTASSATCNYTGLPIGADSVTAMYLGDTNYAASTSNTAIVTISGAVATLQASISPSIAAPGATATVTAVVTAPNGVVPTGSITATITGVAGAAFTVALPGTANTSTLTVTIPITAPITAGTYSVVVSCTGTNFSCNPVTVPLLVSTTVNGQIATTTVLTATASAAVTGATVLTATVTPAATGAAVPTGTVTFFDGTTPIAIANVGTSGIATATVALSATVTHSLTAVYSGDTVYAGSTSAAITGIGTSNGKIVTTTVLTAAASASVTGSTLLTATITPALTGSAAPTGTVTFFDGTTPIAIANVGTSGVASVTVALSAAATHSLTAVYSGDTVYAGSTSAAITGIGTTAASVATITLSANTANSLAGSNIVLTATVAGLTTTNAGPTGTVSFYLLGTTPTLLGTATLISAGNGIAVATLTTGQLPAGSSIVYATYNGDPNFTAVTSNQVTIGLGDFNVTFNPPTLTLTRGQTGTLTATLNQIGGFGGIVTFGCTPAPNSLVTCNFSPSALQGSGTTVLSVTTTAPKTGALTTPARPGRLLPGLAGGVSVAALLWMLLPGGRRRRLPVLLTLLLAFGLGGALTGCHNGGTFNEPASLPVGGTPLGTTILTITVAGSNGTNTVLHTYFVQVTVQ